MEKEKLITVNPDGNGIKWENSRFFYGKHIVNESKVIEEEI